MSEIAIIPIAERVCDLCNDTVTDERHSVVKPFLLTDWGVVCRECWSKFKHPEEFQIIKAYEKAETVTDRWIQQPMVMEFGDDPWP